ncbi:TlpA disulfide reductase family protein [Yoonia sp.]|uniref:TlpA disulfide reductase family protein n=1 Tax=Yoonia sp. TaxID=2212373 RepID=UPI001A0A92F1|nr:TlpA disulfide reductase family protein [Yoonia sp.]MBE0414437.1 TlpA family protein disulfide reductase [Yoonia sp.]
MRKLRSALLYTALAFVANTGLADIADIAALREGDMRKLTLHSAPMAGSDVPFTGQDGSEMTLAAYRGQYVVLNFWATWCAPCRKEMPHLAALQSELGGDAMQVVTIATGRNPRPAMERFFAEIAVDNLPLHTDGRQALARSMGVLGLPVTVILDPQGQEIARLQGDADWSSDSALAIMRALIDTPA